MEQINFAKWDRLFGKTEQNLIFHSDRYSDHFLQFDEPDLANGFIRSVSTPGMQLTEFSIQSENSICLIDEERESTESVFVLEGIARSQFSNLAQPLSLKKGQHNFQYNRHFGGEHHVSPSFHALTITYNLPFLSELIQCEASPVMEQLANKITNKNAYVASDKSLHWEGRMAEVITSIRNCQFNGVTRYLFIESRMMELFVLQMEQVRESFSKPKSIWSNEDMEKLHAVREFIENNYLDEFSLKDLTLKFALNEFKLKKGYKELFGSTVFGHLHHLRMQKAKHMLIQKEANVSEIAYYIGYNNVSSFSTEFRKRFGFSPGQFSKN